MAGIAGAKTVATSLLNAEKITAAKMAGRATLAKGSPTLTHMAYGAAVGAVLGGGINAARGEDIARGAAGGAALGAGGVFLHGAYGHYTNPATMKSARRAVKRAARKATKVAPIRGVRPEAGTRRLVDADPAILRRYLKSSAGRAKVDRDFWVQQRLNAVRGQQAVVSAERRSAKTQAQVADIWERIHAKQAAFENQRRAQAALEAEQAKKQAAHMQAWRTQAATRDRARGQEWVRRELETPGQLSAWDLDPNFVPTESQVELAKKRWYQRNKAASWMATPWSV